MMFGMKRRRLLANVLVAIVLGAASIACAAQLAADDVREILARADRDRPADLMGRDLSDLDLSNLDFKRANLSGANLFGTRLVSSNLEGVKLVKANLNGAWIMGTNFASADLSDSTMLSPVILGGRGMDKTNIA